MLLQGGLTRRSCSLSRRNTRRCLECSPLLLHRSSPKVDETTLHRSRQWTGLSRVSAAHGNYEYVYLHLRSHWHKSGLLLGLAKERLLRRGASRRVHMWRGARRRHLWGHAQGLLLRLAKERLHVVSTTRGTSATQRRVLGNAPVGPHLPDRQQQERGVLELAASPALQLLELTQLQQFR